MEFLIALLDHPVLLVVILMFVMGFVGMTYEFILRMCGKDPFLDKPSQGNGGVNEEPPEPANVPKPDTDPKSQMGQRKSRTKMGTPQWNTHTPLTSTSGGRAFRNGTRGRGSKRT